MGAALAVIWSCGGWVLAAWTAQAAGPGWRQASGTAIWLAAGFASGFGWFRSPRGEVEWDGDAWHFASCGAEPPRVALDLHHALLLHMRVEGRALWLWASRRAAPSYWDALRRAVYCRAGHPPPQ